VIVMAKPPELGKVKTRLAVGTSDEFALKVYQELLKHTFDVVLTSGLEYRIYYAWEPKFSNGEQSYFVQGGGDLGARMQRAFTETFEAGYDQVIMIGADCPGLQISHLEQGITSLQSADVVTGPSEDGGYYLIGMNEMKDILFSKLPWSTDQLHELTKERIHSENWTHYELEMLFDVDRLEDLEKTTFNAQWIKS
jgi:rSAM/selenodomain-associated transferase 1